ncbi:MAG: hypothetical protein M1830_005700, partial [Pleopsidium flavum]
FPSKLHPRYRLDPRRQTGHYHPRNRPLRRADGQSTHIQHPEPQAHPVDVAGRHHPEALGPTNPSRSNARMDRDVGTARCERCTRAQHQARLEDSGFLSRSRRRCEIDGGGFEVQHGPRSRCEQDHGRTCARQRGVDGHVAGSMGLL